MQLVALTNAKVEAVISLAVAAHPAPDSGVEDMDSGGAVPVGDLVDGMLHRSPERVALGRYLDQLSPDELAELIALMWLGRGDAGELPGDFPNLVSRARSEQFVPNYAASKAPLGRYLRSGLRKLESA
jgi:hypothetical protein